MLDDGVCHEPSLTVTFGCSVQRGSLLSFSCTCVTTASSLFSWRHWGWHPTTSAELVCGQWLLVTSTVKQPGWGDNFVTASLLFLNLSFGIETFVNLMGSSCASTGNSPLLKKRFCGMRQCWWVFLHPRRRNGGSWAQREQLFAPLPVDLVSPAILLLERCTARVCCLPASQPPVLIASCSLACKAGHRKCNRKSSVKLLQNPFVSKLRFGEKSTHFPEARGIYLGDAILQSLL